VIRRWNLSSYPLGVEDLSPYASADLQGVAERRSATCSSSATTCEA